MDDGWRDVLFVGIADLLLGCFVADFEDFIWGWMSDWVCGMVLRELTVVYPGSWRGWSAWCLDRVCEGAYQTWWRMCEKLGIIV